MTKKEILQKLISILEKHGLETVVDVIDSIDDNISIKNEIIDLFQSTNQYVNAEDVKASFIMNAVTGAYEGKKINSDTKQKDLSIVTNKDTPFYDKRVVITGEFEKYPNREELAGILKQLGADINSSISKKTDIVCIGANFGPKKMEKIIDLQNSGALIATMEESELYNILENLQS